MPTTREEILLFMNDNCIIASSKGVVDILGTNLFNLNKLL
jgi:hypothetical protein